MNRAEKETITNAILSEIKMAKMWANDWLNTEDKETAETYQTLTSTYHHRANAIIELLCKLGIITEQQMAELNKDIYNCIMGKE